MHILISSDIVHIVNFLKINYNYLEFQDQELFCCYIKTIYKEQNFDFKDYTL